MGGFCPAAGIPFTRRPAPRRPVRSVDRRSSGRARKREKAETKAAERGKNLTILHRFRTGSLANPRKRGKRLDEERRKCANRKHIPLKKRMTILSRTARPRY